MIMMVMNNSRNRK